MNSRWPDVAYCIYLQGTDAIEGILVDMPGPDEIFLSDTAFANMKRLRLLIVHNARFSSGPDYLPNNLRWLEWSNYPSPSLPHNFHPKKLAVLKLKFGSMAHLWDGLKRCSDLTIMQLDNCHSLHEIPDVSTIPNLEKLIVNQCSSLVKVHESVGLLKKLVFLNFGDCSKLRSLPPKLRLTSLETLRLSGCTSLERFPDILESMERVQSIDLSESAVQELPSSIGNLTGLQHLDLHSCRNLRALPSSIYNLQRVEELNLKDCMRLQEFPVLIYPKLDENKLTMPSSSGLDVSLRCGFPMLEFLDASNCGISSLDFLEAPNCFSKLETLDLSESNLVTLSSVGKFSELKNLHLNDCKQLREILELPPNINLVDASGCESLERLQAWNLRATSQFKVNFSNCHKLRDHLAINELLDKAFTGETEFHVIIPGGDIPSWFNHQFTNHSMHFEVHTRLQEKLIGLGISVAFCLEDRVSAILKCDLSVNGELVESLASDLDEALVSDHLWLGYFPLTQKLEEMQAGWNRLEVAVKFVDYSKEEYERVVLKGCGYRFVGNTEEEEVNESTAIRFLCPENSGVFPEEAIDASVDLMEDVRFTGTSADLGSNRVLMRKRCRNGTDAASSGTSSDLPQEKKKRCYRRRWKHRIGARMGLSLKLSPFNISNRKRRKRKGN
ncbi:hypothetical protein CDL15_Pgr024158 [Punica granatum]|uniref:Disease resistance protein RPS4B/Roq1-like leucine-rich repeats domain-containing protein n=1 Tax=Punica granatum TaxID=22663 RepID=A0A218XX52_PUNGR|nr:hypothetical protein CDL15_Pgr024158 [Punica granatum]